MAEDIPALPSIPENLRLAARRGGVIVPFVGAGVSQLAGSPGWNEFADGALKFFIDRGKFTHNQLDQIRDLNPRVKMSVALQLQKEHGPPDGPLIGFKTLLHPPGHHAQSLGEHLYAHLAKLSTTFVTTNYDEWLDQEIAFPEHKAGDPQPTAIAPIRTPRRSIYKKTDLTVENLNAPNTVIHLHGSLIDPSEMILTTRHYVQHYANDRLADGAGDENQVLTFLGNLFQLKSVLFLGYGLAELEVLEYVILKARHTSARTGEAPRHFIVQGFFSHERELMQSMKRYFLADCGIELMPFLRDHKDWAQLIDVVEYLARELPAQPATTSEKLLEMNGLLGD